MDYNYQYTSSPEMERQAAFSNYMAGTFRWMALGLLITFGMAFATAYTGLFYVVYRLYLPLTIAELALVWIFSARIHSLSRGAAAGLFLGYAALNGMVLSFYFLAFDASSLMMAFLAAAVFFGLMSYYGLSTERDLLPKGRVLLMGLISLIVCSLIGVLLGWSPLYSALYCALGLAVFFGLTAYDVQKLRANFAYFENDGDMLARCSIYGALSLYLDFINIFLLLVRLLGNRRRN